MIFGVYQYPDRWLVSVSFGPGIISYTVDPSKGIGEVMRLVGLHIDRMNQRYGGFMGWRKATYGE